MRMIFGLLLFRCCGMQLTLFRLSIVGPTLAIHS